MMLPVWPEESVQSTRNEMSLLLGHPINHDDWRLLVQTVGLSALHETVLIVTYLKAKHDTEVENKS